jgi:hypothetical protein
LYALLWWATAVRRRPALSLITRIGTASAAGAMLAYAPDRRSTTSSRDPSSSGVSTGRHNERNVGRPGSLLPAESR